MKLNLKLQNLSIRCHKGSLSRFKIYKSDDIVVSTRFKFEHENKVQEREKSTLNYANFLST